jgi:ribosomal protein S1
MKSLSKFSLLALLAVGLSVSSLPAADERSEQGASFKGKVSSIDKSAQTFKVDGETYQLLPTSRITKHEKRAVAGDLAVGQQVEGQFKRSAEDKREVLSMDVTKAADTSMGAARDRETSESGATFQGRISRVNRNADTIRVGNHTYHVLPTTQISRASGEATTLSNLRQDQRVRGTYKESAEGKRELLSLEVGRRSN